MYLFKYLRISINFILLRCVGKLLLYTLDWVSDEKLKFFRLPKIRVAVYVSKIFLEQSPPFFNKFIILIANGLFWGNLWEIEAFKPVLEYLMESMKIFIPLGDITKEPGLVPSS